MNANANERLSAAAKSPASCAPRHPEDEHLVELHVEEGGDGRDVLPRPGAEDAARHLAGEGAAPEPGARGAHRDDRERHRLLGDERQHHGLQVEDAAERDAAHEAEVHGGLGDAEAGGEADLAERLEEDREVRGEHRRGEQQAERAEERRGLGGDRARPQPHEGRERRRRGTRRQEAQARRDHEAAAVVVAVALAVGEVVERRVQAQPAEDGEEADPGLHLGERRRGRRARARG